MSRIPRFCRNIGWFGVLQFALALCALILLAALEGIQQHWASPLLWSPAIFLVPAPFITTRTLLMHMSWIQLLMRAGQAAVLGLLVVGIFAYQNGAVFLDYMVPAAWFTLGISFWMLSHPMVMTKRRSMFEAARQIGRFGRV